MEEIIAKVVERFQGDKWVFGTCTITYIHLVKFMAIMLNVSYHIYLIISKSIIDNLVFIMCKLYTSIYNV